MCRKIYLDWIHKIELRGVSQKASAKIVHQFDWGLEHLRLDKNESDPMTLLNGYIDKNLHESQLYFMPPKVGYVEFNEEKNFIRFESNIKSPYAENNIVKANYFPSKNKNDIIIVVPHWNADGEKYDKMCSLLNKLKFSCLRLVMPYHEERDPFGPPDSTWMVSANIGLTIQAMRQCVHDIRNCIDWLEMRGYKNFAVMGASLGSCATALAAYHDSRIKGFFANFISSYFGDVVWTGASTIHIKNSLEGRISLEDLRHSWLLNSPIAFVDKIKMYNPSLQQEIIIGKYDETFLFDLTRKLIKEYETNSVTSKNIILPCGHYSLGRSFFRYIDSIAILFFFNRVFSTNHSNI